VEALGIRVHTGSRTTAVLGRDTVTGVSLRDKPDIACDMVVVAAGIRPNVDVAVLSGLPVERAIVVDDRLRVQDEEDIYAVGECVQHRGEVYGLVAPLWEQAVVLANHVTGTDTSSAYLGSRTATKLKVAGVEVASMGLHGPELDTDEHIVFSEPSRGVFKSIVVRDNKMVGATLLGDSRKVAYLTQAYDRGLPLPEERIGLMFDLGTPGEDVGVAERMTVRRSATATASARKPWWMWSRAAATRLAAPWTPPGRARAAVPASSWCARWSNGPRTAPWRRIRPPATTCPASRWTSRP
jgi:nitrite reductase (NADH) large subunit